MHNKNIDSKEQQHRRRFLKGLSAVIGSFAAGQFIFGEGLSVAQAYDIVPGGMTGKGQVLSAFQLKQLAQVCRQVLPRTETPSAADVDCHGFIDNQLAHCYEQHEQRRVANVLNSLNSAAKNDFQLTFIDVQSTQQVALLNAIDTAQPPFNKAQTNDFKFLKSLICFGYYTSEVGASQELRFDPIPNGYKGSITLSDNDSNWGSQGLFY
ncbi:gluconate 2-dehydrogenase subunit 3 family protein [Shewanella sp.]|nr:gluconate 2-dehydrogenase subunit 3 family protein [Shewanella sp.]